MSASDVLQSATFSSAPDGNFWHAFTKLKLEVLKLNTDPVNIAGIYVHNDPQNLPLRLNVDYDSISQERTLPLGSFAAPGILIITNTIEEFQQHDKCSLLKKAAEPLWEAIVSGRAIENPIVLSSFLLFTFADLKKYLYYYWFAFPAFMLPNAVRLACAPIFLSSIYSKDQVMELVGKFDAWDNLHKNFFCLVYHEGLFKLHFLKEYPQLMISGIMDVFLGFADPSTLPENPGWPLRNLLTLVAVKWPQLGAKHKVVCLRIRRRAGHIEAGHSLQLQVDLGCCDSISEMPKVVGWERNERDKMRPRVVNLQSSMDPVKLAESAVNLNLSLMRWRVAPTLDLQVIRNTKVLLLGAGTLGCNVARCLLGWGVREITFVDSGRVSFSNPVRQTLFTFDDCLEGGKSKAEAAAEALRRIFPGVVSNCKILTIPMPGHTVGESLLSQVKENVAQLEALVESHDVLFLLTDSRESRWLPTVLGSTKHKLVFTAALGFDSYLVMRHGIRETLEHNSASEVTTQSFLSGTPIPGSRLGCYFCNDVVGPGDSMKDRTLDQQCTVTRPGISFMAAAHAAELLISLLQHSDRGNAPASMSEESGVTEGVLGAVPHSVRGFLGRHQQITPAVLAFEHCPACSVNVLSTYRRDGFEFLLKVFNSPSYLEEVAGLDQLLQDTDVTQLWELSDAESDDEL